MAQSVSLFFEHFFFRGSTSQLRQFGVFSNDPGNPPEKRHGWKLPPDVVWRTSWGPKEKDDDTRHRAGEVSDSSRGHEKLPSLKLTWNLKMTPWKRRFLLETIIFRCYVSFREGTQFRILRPIESGILGSSLWWILIFWGVIPLNLELIKQCI